MVDQKAAVYKLGNSWVWDCIHHSNPIAAQLCSPTYHRDPWSVAIAMASNHTLSYHRGTVVAEWEEFDD